MKSTSISLFSFFCLGMSLFMDPIQAAHAQATVPQAGNVPNAIAQAASAFAGAVTVKSIQLSGTATWYAGSLEDSGTVNLTAAANGSSQMQLSLATTGQITESQTGIGTSAQCQWSGKDGVARRVDVGNCWRPALWFLPAFSLQSSVMSSQQIFTDLGQGSVGADETVYHHLQGQITPFGSASSNHGLAALVQRTTTDIGLDPTSSLPAVLAYAVHPDNGASVSIPIEVHYSDYHSVEGVQIPFHIQRYLNGSLQLDILLSSAQIN